MVQLLSQHVQLTGEPDHGEETIIRNLCEAEYLHMPGSPWQNGYCESFNGRLRDELLNGEISYTLWESQVIIQPWRNWKKAKRPLRLTWQLNQ